MKPIIEIENLFFSYPNNPILTDISLRVNEGDFIAIIGPNGGGKTTLLKLILGWLKPTQGKVHVFGKVPNGGMPSASHPPIAYVPQVTRFDRQFPISVLEVVLGGLLYRLPWYGKYNQKDYKDAMQALEHVGLVSFHQKPFGTLSGGQAQRILIARALVCKPQLLLLDEPTASVDSQAEAGIYAILRELKGQMTVLMITHDIRAVIDHIGRVFCIQGTAMDFNPAEICEHFGVGLYHPPVLRSRGSIS